jgi:hypothetical protein
MLGGSWVATQLAGPQEGLSSIIEWVTAWLWATINRDVIKIKGKGEVVKFCKSCSVTFHEDFHSCYQVPKHVLIFSVRLCSIITHLSNERQWQNYETLFVDWWRQIVKSDILQNGASSVQSHCPSVAYAEKSRFASALTEKSIFQSDAVQYDTENARYRFALDLRWILGEAQMQFSKLMVD